MEGLRLEQLPITEEEYFVLIDSVMGVLGNDLDLPPSERYRKLLERGKFESSEINIYLFRSLTAMTEAMCTIFHVGLPLERYHLDESAESFDDWYARMTLYYQVNDYESLICSACPFSFGPREFLLQGKIVCGKNIKIRKLFQPFLCGMISFGGWRESDLLRELHGKHGEKVLQRYLAKQQELIIETGILIIAL